MPRYDVLVYFSLITFLHFLADSHNSRNSGWNWWGSWYYGLISYRQQVEHFFLSLDKRLCELQCKMNSNCCWIRLKFDCSEIDHNFYQFTRRCGEPFKCSPNIPSGLLCQETHRKCGQNHLLLIESNPQFLWVKLAIGFWLIKVSVIFQLFYTLKFL